MKRFLVFLFFAPEICLSYKLSDFSQAFLERLGFSKPKEISQDLPESPQEYFLEKSANEDRSVDAKAELYDLFLKTEYQIAKTTDGTAKMHSDLLVNICKNSQAYQTHAKALFQCGQFDRISQIFNKTNLQECLDSDFWLMCAKAFLSIGVTSKADEIMSMAIEKFPDKEQVVYQKTMLEIKNDNLEKAEQICKEFLAKSTPKAVHHIFYELMAVVHLKINPKATAQAFEFLNKALELNPKSISAYNTKIMVLENMLENNQANEQLKKFLIATILQGGGACQNKQESDFFVKKLILLNQFALAYKQFLLFHDPTNAQDQVTACFLAFQSSQKSLALKHAGLATECDSSSDNLKALVFKLVLSLEEHEISDSIKNMIITYTTKNGSLASIAKKALFHIAANTQDSALEKVLTSKLSKKNPADQYLLANLYFSKKQFSQALEQYKKINQSLPRGQTTLVFRKDLLSQISICSAFTMDLAQALEFAKQALSLDQESCSTYALMGLILAGMGEPDKSIYFANAALKMNPFHQEAQEALCWALLQKNKLHLAVFLSKIFGLQNPPVGLTLTKHMMILGGIFHKV